MRKPRGYEEAMVLGEYEKLELGGHICVIKKVEETLSRTNKDMIRIYLDIAEGPQKDYYADQYRNDTRDQKKWGCIVNQIVEDKNGNTSPGALDLKPLLTRWKSLIPALTTTGYGMKNSAAILPGSW